MVVCHYCFLITPSFSASGKLLFLIAAFSGYLHLFFWFDLKFYGPVNTIKVMFKSVNNLLTLPGQA